MKHVHKILRDINPLFFSVALAGTLTLGLFSYAYARIFALTEEVKILTMELASTTNVFSEKTDYLNNNLSTLDKKTLGLSDTLRTTKETLQNTEAKVGGVEETVGKISGSVNTLEKLSKTDPELLQKYSKVFFLSENYAPERLAEIPKEYLYSEDSPETIHSLVFSHLKELIEASKREKVILYVKSAYRSFDEQKNLKSSYTMTYGVGSANQFSADQGYSEHQLGTTVDFITTGLGGGLEGFDGTKAYEWLLNNAYKYGFILSYPKSNGYYIFEPWHWRYVGIKFATFLYDQKKDFYTLDQREIDMYLVDIFE